MEAVGAAASILAIAGAGIQISLKLIAFADQVSTAPKRIQDVGTDVSVTAGTLQELGELMKKMPTRRSAGLFNLDQVQNIVATSTRCEAIFDELKEILSKASQQLRDVYNKSTAKSHVTASKIELSRLERMKWPFLHPSMQPLQGALNSAKGTLTLILQVVHLRHAQTTASLNREEQSDLIRTIAAIWRRQQLGPVHDAIGGSKDLDFGITEASDSEDSSEGRTALEAWSVTPNTISDDAFQHFLITPIPVSQQQIAKLLKTSPQDFREVASVIDSLSPPERDAVLGRILDVRRSPLGESTIRSVSSQSWTGSHDLFGKVTGRKFKLIIERQVRKPKFSQANMKERAARKTDRYHSDSVSPTYDSFSEVEAIYDRTSYGRGSSPSPPPRDHRRRQAHAPAMPPSKRESRRQNQAHSMPYRDRRRPTSDNDRKRKQDIEEKIRKEETMFRKERIEKEHMEYQHEYGDTDSQRWTESQPARERSDDELVKSLLAQYTNFDPEEPLVQVFATPPPAYEEAFVIPKRTPRPY